MLSHDPSDPWRVSKSVEDESRRTSGSPRRIEMIVMLAGPLSLVASPFWTHVLER